jgi:hypothetical protein
MTDLLNTGSNINTGSNLSEISRQDLHPTPVAGDNKAIRSPHFMMESRFQTPGLYASWRFLRKTSESPTFVAFTLALFVFFSAISMMTAAQKPNYSEASFKAPPSYSQDLEFGSVNSATNSDECYDTSISAAFYSFAAFEYTAFRDATRIGRTSVHVRHFNARGPPSRA